MKSYVKMLGVTRMALLNPISYYLMKSAKVSLSTWTMYKRRKSKTPPLCLVIEVSKIYLISKKFSTGTQESLQKIYFLIHASTISSITCKILSKIKATSPRLGEVTRETRRTPLKKTPNCMMRGQTNSFLNHQLGMHQCTQTYPKVQPKKKWRCTHQSRFKKWKRNFNRLSNTRLALLTSSIF